MNREPANNTGPVKPEQSIETDLHDEMAAFDRLPETWRHWLNAAKLNYSSVDIERRIARGEDPVVE